MSEGNLNHAEEQEQHTNEIHKLVLNIKQVGTGND